MHTNLRYDEVDRALGTLPPIRRHVPLLTNARLANLLKSSKRRLQRQRCARGLGLSALPTPRPLPVGDGGGHGTASLLSPRQRAHVTRRARFAAVVDGRTTAAPPPHRPNEFHRDGGKGVYHGAPLALASKVAFLSLGQPASKWLSVGPDGDLNAHAPGNENPRAGSVFTLLDVEDDGKTYPIASDDRFLLKVADGVVRDAGVVSVTSAISMPVSPRFEPLARAEAAARRAPLVASYVLGRRGHDDDRDLSRPGASSYDDQVHGPATIPCATIKYERNNNVALAGPGMSASDTAVAVAATREARLRNRRARRASHTLLPMEQVEDAARTAATSRRRGGGGNQQQLLGAVVAAFAPVGVAHSDRVLLRDPTGLVLCAPKAGRAAGSFVDISKLDVTAAPAALLEAGAVWQVVLLDNTEPAGAEERPVVPVVQRGYTHLARVAARRSRKTGWVGRARAAVDSVTVASDARRSGA